MCVLSSDIIAEQRKQRDLQTFRENPNKKNIFLFFIKLPNFQENKIKNRRNQTLFLFKLPRITSFVVF